MKIKTLKDLLKIRDRGLAKIKPSIPRIAVGMSTCGIGNNAELIYSRFEKELSRRKLEALLVPTGCFGFCAAEPLVNIYVPGKPLTIMSGVDPESIGEAVDNIAAGNPVNGKTLLKIREWNHHTSKISYGEGLKNVPSWNEIDFYRGQQKDVLRDCGIINPLDIEEYIGAGGYRPLYDVLRGPGPDEALKEIRESGLRGRGGAGFPVWLKWNMLRENPLSPKYIICNADEGDPGAYMNRNELEGDPHMIIEGMILAGYITGAGEGIIYCRAEYPVAVHRLKKAVKQARDKGILGKKIMGSDFDFEVHIVEGAGAFVCGEETALISSIHGHPGWPMPRPPYPSEKGVYGKPTCINNVETLSNIPMIMARGGEDFAKTGTEKSTGTKVFSLVGKIKNTGLVELPLGTPLRKLVYDIGGGAGKGRSIKAVQTGGPSGGCIPSGKFESTIDYEALAEIGAIMGSGGVVVMDEDNCMVDVAHYFTEFTTSESCGKCVPCREGINHSLDMLAKIKKGEGKIKLLEELDSLSGVIKDTALCGLGQTGPNPVLTTMKYFGSEYISHIKEGYCQAGVCGDLFISPCENSCPLQMNVPGYLQLLKEERQEEAFELILKDNPLPSTMGRICHFHCKMRCRREDIDAPVAQGEVHRYIADQINKEGKLKAIEDKIRKRRLPSTSKKIGVIGSGPAGLAASFYLALMGHKVKVYEKKSEPGGILRWGIPSYRLPREVLEREIGFIEKLGVEIKTGRKITAEEFKKLKKRNDAMVMAAGAYSSRELKIPGAGLKGVMSGTGYLEAVASGTHPSLGKKTIIIGGGNVAIDAARTALRTGAEVTLLYRRGRDDMPAIEHEINDASEEKIKFKFWRTPKEFLGSSGNLKSLKAAVTRPGEYDSSGRPRPVPAGRSENLKCDSAIIAVGEGVEKDYLAECGITLSSDGTAAADPFSLKLAPGVYGAGDVVSGPSTAAQALAMGKKVALNIDRELEGGERFNSVFEQFSYSMEVPSSPGGGGPRKIKKIKLKDRLNSFSEVSRGLTKSQARSEALRCLRCDVK